MFLLFDFDLVSLLLVCLLRSSLFVLLLVLSLFRKLLRRDSIRLLSLLYKLFFFCKTSLSWLSCSTVDEAEAVLNKSKALLSDSLRPDSLVEVSSRRDNVLEGGEPKRLSTMKLSFELEMEQSMSSNNLSKGLIGLSGSNEPKGKSDELGSMLMKLLRSWFNPLECLSSSRATADDKLIPFDFSEYFRPSIPPSVLSSTVPIAGLSVLSTR